MTDREIMQMALDVLDKLNKDGWILADFEDEVCASIEALRAALAQPEQKPTAYLCENAVGHKYFRWKKPSSEYKPIALYTAPPQQPEQEPNPWRFAAQRLGEDLSTVGPDGYYNMSASEWLNWAMKHITPARIEQEPVAQFKFQNYGWWRDEDGKLKLGTMSQREWVGLTDEERLALWSNIECDLECLKPAQYARAIEAKLRGKNGG